MELNEIIQQAENIVFFGGAGVSTESGIPDFRSESGNYSTVKEYGVSPETILSHTFFSTEPGTFYDFYRKRMIYNDAKPNDAHKALSTLETIGKLTAVITQNIDGLHQIAGSKNVLEIHGSIHRNYCVSCHESYGLDYIINSIDVPKCRKCGNIVKPDVVLYEESLDELILSKSVSAIQEADTLIIGGTSLSVYPAAGLIHYFNGNYVVLINKGATTYDSTVDLLINDSIGKVLKDVVKKWSAT